MPPKEIANLKLGFFDESCKFREISYVPLQVSDIPDSSNGCCNINRWKNQEINFEFVLNVGLSFADFILVFFYGFDIDKVKQNNWRKQHGIPMKRRRKCRV